MTRRFPVRTLTTTGLLLAVGLLLPMVFHSLFGAEGGKMFLPMHYAVLLGGLLLGPVAGAFLGIATPVLSTLMTGMPPVAILPPMVVELAVYGLVAGVAIATGDSRPCGRSFSPWPRAESHWGWQSPCWDHPLV